MPTARVSLTQPIESRSASLAKDAYSKNCYFESKGQSRQILKRPGTGIQTLTGTAIPAANGQGVFAFSTALFIAVNNIMYRLGGTAVTALTTHMTGNTGNCYFNQTATTPYMTVHNQSHLYTYTVASGDLTAVADINTILGTGYTLVPGLVYLDGYTFAMRTDGRIYASAIENPTAWNTQDYTTAEAEPDLGVGIVKHLNYLVAFGQWSTEFFYDAGSSTWIPGAGSPLLRNDSARLEIGCYDGNSIAQIEQSIIWIGTSKTLGNSVYMLDGLTPIKISTPYIERYLNYPLTPNISANTFKIEGHTLYVLNLKELDLTFVYDVDEKIWYNWSFAVIASPGGPAIVGDAVAGTAIVGNNTTTPGSVTEHFFQPAYIAPYAGSMYALDSANGKIYVISLGYTSDTGSPIYFTSTTDLMDSGTTKRKFYRRVEIVGDKIAATMYVRHTDTDYQSWSQWRSVDLSKSRPQLYQLGSGRRRAWQFQCTDNVALRLEAAEIDFDVGGMEQA